MATINESRAAQIASHWHGDQHSALYSLASTKRYFPHLAAWYRRELYMDLEPDGQSPHPVTRKKAEIRELNALLGWVAKQEKRLGIVFEDAKHPTYGYRVAILKNANGHEVEPVHYPN